jgi:hypothetical protein
VTGAMKAIMEVVGAEYPRIEVYSEERIAARVTRGEREVLLEIWLDSEWLRLHEQIAGVDAFADDELVELLRKNEGAARIRFATDGSSVVARADHPLHRLGTDGLVDLLRSLHETAMGIEPRGQRPR